MRIHEVAMTTAIAIIRSAAGLTTGAQIKNEYSFTSTSP